MAYNEQDLDMLISEKLTNCNGLPEVCKMLQNETGRRIVAARVKKILYEDDIVNIEAALSKVEQELTFSQDN